MLLEDWLDDLCVRFIINIPQEELVELERICFQIEEAQWFYEDFIRPLDPKLPSLGLKPFFQRIISRCPVFKDRPHEDWASAYDRFILYKNRVPVRGAILLNEKMDHVLLVKGWKKTATWSFPRGKINKDEPDIDCAMREAWEETGFDIKAAGLVKEARKMRHIEKTLRDQSVKLFVFRGVPIDYPFVPQTRKEISKCEWYKISDLPTSAKSKQIHQEGTGHHLVVNANKFYMVAPFVQELKKIISQLRKGDHRQSSKLAAPPTDIEALDTQRPDDRVNMASLEAPIIMSPAVPSSLPEVDPISTLEQSLRLKQQLDIQPSTHLEKSNPAMSNALLSMLRGGPVAEMRHDPQTPLETPAHPSSIPGHMQSPPPVEMQQISYPVVPSITSSDHQPLNQHTRSLLDTFSQPKVESPALEARQQLPPLKQDLLAALMSKPKTPSATQADKAPSTNHGSNLLQMLQRNANVSEASTQTMAHAEPATQTALAQEIAAVHSPVQPPQARSNPLLDLLKGSGPAATPVSRPATSVSISAEVPATPFTESFKQVPPAELSATSEYEKKNSSAEAVKTNAISMRDAMSPKTARNPHKEPLRKGSTTANLSGPIMQPQFDAIKAPVSEDDMKRPTAGPRKLFDHKNVEFRPSPVKIASRHEDRNRQKSPRMPRHQKPSHAGQSAHPKEPKEAPKPFQPQILKRPQTAEGEAAPFAALSNTNLPADGLVRTMTTQSPDPVFTNPTSSRANSAIPDDSQPVSPSLVVPANLMTTATTKPVVPQDPQREALLSLLRTPTQAQSQPKSQKSVSAVIDLDSTPRPITIPFTGSESQTVQPTPLSSPSLPLPFFSSQIVSPVNEVDLASTRSRVSSMASMGNGLPTGGTREGSMSTSRPQPEKRQTAAGDKAFLMSYLKGFATQGQEAS